MIDKDLLASLMRMLDESTLDNLEIERGGTRIRLSKSPSGVQVAGGSLAGVPGVAQPQKAPEASANEPAASPDPPPTAAATSNLVEVKSPMVGTFYRAPSPEADPYVRVGEAVAAGEVLCVIEAMKLMNELECEVAGRIAEVCVENAEPVDYGQVLFRVEST